MVKVVQTNVLVMALVLWVCSAFQAAAQVSQWCPPAGTVVKGKNTNGEFTSTHKGADPKDGTVCITLSEGPGISGLIFGKPVRRIYAWYDLTTYTMTSETEKRAREGVGAVLSGRNEQVSFEMTLNRPGSNYGSYSGTETWNRTGQTTITIGGRQTNVITLRETFKGGANTSFDGYWDLWYDPVLHLFVKGEQHTFGGPIRFATEAITIVLP
jgi:hypothetical protein